jgi:hypothetical protein
VRKHGLSPYFVVESILEYRLERQIRDVGVTEHTCIACARLWVPSPTPQKTMNKVSLLRLPSASSAVLVTCHGVVTGYFWNVVGAEESQQNQPGCNVVFLEVGNA